MGRRHNASGLFMRIFLVFSMSNYSFSILSHSFMRKLSTLLQKFGIVMYVADDFKLIVMIPE